MLGFCEKHFEASDIPDLTGRVAIVTGGNTGLGLITVKELARHGARVYMASRTESRAREAITKLKDEVPTAKVEFLPFDLTDLKSGKKAAETFLAKEKELHILICNAGIMATPYNITSDGIEGQACNGVGHYAITAPLLPILTETAKKPNSHVRIVNVSSMGHNFASKPDFTSLETLNQNTGSTWSRYGNSKLSNILLSNELQRRLAGTGIYCLSLHPGSVATELNRFALVARESFDLTRQTLCTGTAQSYPWLSPVIGLQKYILMTPEQGALTQLYAATSLEVEEKDLKAAYLTPYGKVSSKSILAEDKDGTLAASFWALCGKLVAEKS